MNVDNVFIYRRLPDSIVITDRTIRQLFDQKHYQNVFVLKLTRQHMVGRTLCVTSLLVQSL